MSTAARTVTQPTAPTPCSTCRTGCDCNGAVGDLDCGHYGCWGRGRTKGQLDRCPGVAYERARAAAVTANEDVLRRARHHGGAVYARVLANVLTSAGLTVTED